MPQHRETIRLSIFSVFALAATLLVPLQCWRTSQSEWLRLPPKPIGDGIDYEAIGYCIWQNGEFCLSTSDPNWQQPYRQRADIYADVLKWPARDGPTTSRPPLWPLVIAATYAVLGRDATAFMTLRYLNACLVGLAQALAVSLAFWYARDRLLFMERESQRRRLLRLISWGVLIGACFFLAAVHRTVSSYTTDFLTEPLALFLMQVWILVTLRATVGAADSFWVAGFGHPVTPGLTNGIEHSYSGVADWRFWLLSGILFGALTLTRSVFAAWLPFVGLLVWLAAGGNWLPRTLKSAIWGAGVCGVCLPWWLRNCIVLGAFMPLGTQGPVAILGGYNDAALRAGGEWQYEAELKLRRKLEQSTMYRLAPLPQRELLLARAASREAQQWIHNHWADVPFLFAQRVLTHWGPLEGRDLIWKLLILVGLTHVAWYGRRFRIWLLGVPLISTLVTMFLYTTGGRFLVPCYGLLYPLAAIGAAFIATKVITLSAVPRYVKNHEENYARNNKE